MSKIVITDSDLGGYDIERMILRDHDVVVVESGQRRDVLEAVSDADVALVQWERVDREFLDAAPRLRGVVRYGMGLDNVDLDLSRERDVAVRNVVDTSTSEVAQHAVGMILAAHRRLWLTDRAVRDGSWGPAVTSTPEAVEDARVGLVGFGRIGRAVAGRLRALGYPVAVWDPFAEAGQIVEQGAERCGTLDELAGWSTYLSLHAPLSDTTRGMIDATVLAALGSEGHLVNTSRGGLVDEAALLRALESHRIASASLDVLHTEPPVAPTVSHELAHHARVLVTPHIAYLSLGSIRKVRETAAIHALALVT